MDKKSFWMNALNWGCLAGVALFVLRLVMVLLKFESPVVDTVLTVAILAGVIYVSGRANAAAAGGYGYSYARAIGFVFATMLFAGLVVGIGNWFLQNIIAPEYFDVQMAEALAKAGPQAEEAAGMMGGIMKSPIVVILGGVIGTMFIGGLIGLVVCAFVTRKPDVFAAE